MPTETAPLTTEEAQPSAFEAVGAGFMPEPAAEAPPVETETPTTPEVEAAPVIDKNLQMQQQILASLERLADRKEKLDIETAGRDKPLTVAQQTEQATIARQKERHIAKLREIRALPPELDNAHDGYRPVLDTLDEHDTELEATKAELAKLREEVKPLLAEREEVKTFRDMEKSNPDAKADWETCVKEVLEFVGGDLETGAPPKGMSEEELGRQMKARYDKIVAGKKKAPAVKKDPPPRGPPKTTGGGTMAAQHEPAGTSQNATPSRTFADVGREFMGIK